MVKRWVGEDGEVREDGEDGEGGLPITNHQSLLPCLVQKKDINLTTITSINADQSLKKTDKV